MAKRYWTCEVTYDGKEPFRFYSPAFHVEAESELGAEQLLKPIVASEWSKISPHPAPRLLAVVRGQLVLMKETSRG